MKYESAILQRLIDTYGVVGNPRYISEIIKEFILQGKECYPNLFTYQSDWLAHIDEFGLNPTYTVSYTGQSIYAPNTLERPVKSAILKGNTGYRDIDTGEILETFEEGRNLELVSVKMPVLTTTGKNLLNVESVFKVNGNTVKEAKDGSVVLYKTSHNSFILETIKVKANTTYTISCKIEKIVDGGRAVYGLGGVTENKTAMSDSSGNLALFMRAGDQNSEGEYKFYNIQLEEGSTATPYEPYKSNILTVNEPIELRGIGDVQDTLDCLTGEMTERISEIVLDGSEKWTVNGDRKTAVSYICNSIIGSLNANNIKCSEFPTRTDGEKNDVEMIRLSAQSGKIIIHILKSKVGIDVNTTVTNGDNASHFKQWLSKNPITVQYGLTTESIKTVDLTILDQNGQSLNQPMSFNGGTHFNTMSAEGSPLPSVVVSVETDLEETLKVCSLEGNTL